MSEINNDNQRPEQVENHAQEAKTETHENILAETTPRPPRDGLGGLGVDGTAAGALIRAVNTEPAGGYFDPETMGWTRAVIRDFRTVDLDASVPKLEKMHRKTHFEESVSKGHYADRFIMTGEVLLQIKKQAARQHTDFNDWADDNLDFMGKRLIQQAMQLARVKGIKEHTRFGKERLTALVSASKDFGGDDPIGAFLAEYHIPFNPEVEQETKEYKAEVDKACAHHRFCKALAKNKVPNRDVTFELFKRLIDKKVKPSANLIQEIKLAHKKRQPVGEYLESLKQDEEGEYAHTVITTTKAKSVKGGIKDINARLTWLKANISQAKDAIDEEWLTELETAKATIAELIRLKRSLEDPNVA